MVVLNVAAFGTDLFRLRRSKAIRSILR
jgi:hypothetical protein